MKKSLFGLAILAASMSAPTLANNGSAFIPHFLTDPGSKFYSYIYLTNISNSPIDVTIKLNDMDGNQIFDDGNGATGLINGALGSTSYAEPTSGETVTLTIPAKGTSSIRLEPTAYNQGFGSISWTSNDDSRQQAMLAYGRVLRHTNGYESSYPIMINNGLPF